MHILYLCLYIGKRQSNDLLIMFSPSNSSHAVSSELYVIYSGWLLYLHLSSPFHSSDAIYSALYDGSGIIEILRGHEYLSHPFAVSLFGGSVYWTDWRTNTLARANKWTGRNVTVIQKTSAQPFDLQIFHPSRQPQGKQPRPVVKQL